MKYLLDTHIWFWWLGYPKKLSAEVHEILSDSQNDIYFSVASSWEINIKFATGKMELPCPPDEYIDSRLTQNHMSVLPIGLSHTYQTARLPHHHKDPFDRMLIAQSIVEDIPIITADPNFKKYKAKIIWGGI